MKKSRSQNPQAGYISKSSLRSVRVSARKARLVADLIRGKKVGVALDLLGNCDKKTAPIMKKLVLSAAHSAKKEHEVDVDQLFVKSAVVNERGMLQRFMPRAQGRATPIRKRSSSITIILDEIGAK